MSKTKQDPVLSDRTSISICADVIDVTCKKFRNCDTSINYNECLEYALPTCALYEFDTSKVTLVYSSCIPAIETATCEEMSSEIEECTDLLVVGEE